LPIFGQSLITSPPPRTSDPAIRRVTTTPYPYLIFYEATETEIIIHAIRHGARDPSGMPGSA
jgi:toxin ParE1/3/4